MIKDSIIETNLENINSDILQPAEKKEESENQESKAANPLKIVAEPAYAVLSGDAVAAAIEGRLTTAEKETVNDAGKSIADRLLTVKSLVTLTLTAAFAYLSVTGEIETESFMQVFIMIIGFYFGVQTVKDKQ